jgi:hypothetical protein
LPEFVPKNEQPSDGIEGEMKITKRFATLFGAVALLAGSSVAASAANAQPDFRGQSLASGLTNAQATKLQERVDSLLATTPGGRQISPTKVAYDGYSVTAETASAENAGASIACAYGHLCVTVRGYTFDYYKCGNYWVENWYGNGEFNNNQTPGTVAKFHNQDGSVRWTSRAPQQGTATWDPIYSVTPC